MPPTWQILPLEDVGLWVEWGCIVTMDRAGRIWGRVPAYTAAFGDGAA